MLRSMIASALVIASPAVAQKANPQAAIEAAMKASGEGWNAGNLDRFMAVYAGDAVYAAGNELARGKSAIAARYAKSFAGAGNSRGRLSFQPVAWRTLSAVHMLLVARWTLTPAEQTKAQTGLTTLLFERRPEGWRIISDHSS